MMSAPGSRRVTVHPDGSRVYVAKLFTDTVSVIDASSESVTATIPAQRCRSTGRGLRSQSCPGNQGRQTHPDGQHGRYSDTKRERKRPATRWLPSVPALI